MAEIGQQTRPTDPTNTGAKPTLPLTHGRHVNHAIWCCHYRDWFERRRHPTEIVTSLDEAAPETADRADTALTRLEALTTNRAESDT